MSDKVLREDLTKEPIESLRERETAAAVKLQSIVSSMAYVPPEGMTPYLMRARDLLHHHFAESIARSEAAFVHDILRKIEARKSLDPEFAEELKKLQNA